MKGKRIKSLNELKKAVEDRRSVCNATGSIGFARNPAAWIWMQSACRVHHLIEIGLYIYKPQKKK